MRGVRRRVVRSLVGAGLRWLGREAKAAGDNHVRLHVSAMLLVGDTEAGSVCAHEGRHCQIETRVAELATALDDDGLMAAVELIRADKRHREAAHAR